jgi:hypothetical protein
MGRMEEIIKEGIEFVRALFYALILAFHANMSCAEESTVRTGVPACRDITSAYLSPEFRQKFDRLVIEELGIYKKNGGSLDGLHMAVSDCEVFYSVTLFPRADSPDKAGRKSMHLGSFIIFFFVKNEFITNGFPTG